jgi:hypothetical protein
VAVHQQRYMAEGRYKACEGMITSLGSFSSHTACRGHLRSQGAKSKKIQVITVEQPNKREQLVAAINRFRKGADERSREKASQGWLQR